MQRDNGESPASAPASEVMAADGAADPALPWERRDELGTAKALFGTVKLFALTPASAFARLDPAHGIRGPLVFGLFIAGLALLLNILGGVVFGSIAIFNRPPELRDAFEIEIAGESLAWIPLLAALVGGSFVGTLVALVVFPPIFAAGLFVWSAVLSLSLRVVGAIGDLRAGFAATFAVAAYSSLAFVAHLIPVVGDLAATVWLILLLTIGLAVVHGTTRVRTLIGVLLPVVVLIAGLALAALAG